MSDAAYLSKFFVGSAEEFGLAMPESHFNTLVTAAAQAIAASAPIGAPVFRDLQNQLLTLPARFRDVLPAVAGTEMPDAQRGPARVSAADAQQMYLDSRENVAIRKLEFLGG